MSSASGSRDESKPLPGLPFVTRRRWRVTGVVCLVIAAVMAWNGVAFIGADWSWLVLLGYWGVIVLLIAVAVYTVLLDLRFTQLHYVLAEREIFLDTLGSEEFRREIRRVTGSTPASGSSGGHGGGSAETPKEGQGNP